MASFKLLNPIRRANRRAMAACCVALYTVACAGFTLPVPIPAGSVDHSVPFPCQHHNCGCNSAEQCWNNCCCMNMAERLAWARENNVQPPSWVAAATHDEPADREAKCSSGCCQKEKISHAGLPHHDESTAGGASDRHLPATCGTRKRTTDASATCCSKSSSCCQSATACTSEKSACCLKSTASVKKQNKTSLGWLNIIQAQKCSGQALDWVVAGATVLPALAVTVETDTTSFWIETAQTLDPLSPFFRPEIPPPRSALV